MGPGEYNMRVKFTPFDSVCNAIWLFNYLEIENEKKETQEATKEHEQLKTNDDDEEEELNVIEFPEEHAGIFAVSMEKTHNAEPQNLSLG